MVEIADWPHLQAGVRSTSPRPVDVIFREFKDVVFEDVVFDNDRFYLRFNYYHN